MDLYNVIISPKALAQLDSYTFLYRTVGTDVYVEAVYHQLQDYENTFAREINS